MKMLISGASIAGPALAFWLGRAGHDVTVVERASRLREGGYTVDFRGKAHMGVLKRMGMIADLRKIETGGGAMRFVDAGNRTRLFLPAEFAGGDLEVRRADLSRVLYERTKSNVRYVFGDSVRALKQLADRVDVAFEKSPPQSYDFVFGADGIHSNIRRLAFPGENFERDLGHYIVSWDASGLGVDTTETVCFNVPGRMIGIQPPSQDGTAPGVLALFASKPLDVGRRDSVRQKDILHHLFAGMAWRTPELLATLHAADDLYFNTISRAKVPRWSQGRVALIGDAAGGVSIGGMGTGSAMVAACVLAGELLADLHDYAAAFRRYQQRVEPYAEEGARNGENSGKFLAPRTAWGLAFRNRFLSIPPVKAWMINLTQKTGAAIDLPEYGLSASDECSNVGKSRVENGGTLARRS
jgi:2-polyprenyl-6-methoxyphenol hydroxylase-like FAD-dependent oxidoreductase